MRNRLYNGLVERNSDVARKKGRISLEEYVEQCDAKLGRPEGEYVRADPDERGSGTVEMRANKETKIVLQMVMIQWSQKAADIAGGDTQQSENMSRVRMRCARKARSSEVRRDESSLKKALENQTMIKGNVGDWPTGYIRIPTKLMCHRAVAQSWPGCWL
jgi:hypothetical protein